MLDSIGAGLEQHLAFPAEVARRQTRFAFGARNLYTQRLTLSDNAQQLRIECIQLETQFIQFHEGPMAGAPQQRVRLLTKHIGP